MRTLEELRRTLHRIDRRGYKAYRDIQGSYALGPLELHVDHVQGDPFARRGPDFRASCTEAACGA
jgi:predicted ABC-class ATPase